MHTNDLHSHFMPYGLESAYTPELDDDPTRGGIGRIATLLERERESLEDGVTFLLYDAGDYSMGTLFSLLGPNHGPELQILGILGYDAITLGNHEFDYFPDPLARSIEAARAAGFDVPLVASNLRFSEEDPADDRLKALFDQGIISKTSVRSYDLGLKVGVFGLLGESAAAVAPNAVPCTFEKESRAARDAVALLQEEGVDLIVCLSHTGVNSAGFGPDRTLAQMVPEIDILVSGHTHVELPQPVRVGKTLILSAGAYAARLGRLKAIVRPGEPVEIESYELLGVDDSVPAQPEIAARLEEFIELIDQDLLAPHGLAYRSPVAKSEFDLSLPRFTEGNLGDLVTDASLHIASERLGHHVDVSVESPGVVRDDLEAGIIWVADAFRVLPLGVGPDLNGGYPLLHFFLSASDLMSGLEIPPISQDLVDNSNFFLQFSGVRMRWDPSLMVFERVVQAEIGSDDEGWEALDPESDRLYEVIVNSYNATLLSLVESQTGGALKIIPRDEAGEPVADLRTRIVDADPQTEGLQELKQWLTFIEFLEGFPDLDADDLPDIPEAYAQPQERVRRVEQE